MSFSKPAAAAVLVLVSVTACGGDDEPAAAPSPTPVTSSVTADAPTPGPSAAPSAPSGTAAATPSAQPSAAPPATAATRPSAGCAPTSSGAPSGTRPKRVVDVDGDGRRDAGWFAGEGAKRRFGITTASGATFTVPLTSGSPIGATALVADADERPPTEVLISDGRTVGLYVVTDCKIVAVTGQDRKPYRFDLGFSGAGTGVGCLDVNGDGRRDLVGLNVVTYDTEANIDRTVIELDGTHAANGATDSVPADLATEQAVVESAQTVSCGDLTLARDGVREPTG